LATALRNGACGYLLKTMESDALAKAILRAMRGEAVVADEMTGKLVAAFRDAAAPPIQTRSGLPASPIAQLSPREQEILRGIARGASNKAIGRELGIAETTVKIHVQHSSASSTSAPVQAADQPSTGWVDVANRRILPPGSNGRCGQRRRSSHVRSLLCGGCRGALHPDAFTRGAS
jgi:DNA-binding CsgD family transcriptional regulator